LFPRDFHQLPLVKRILFACLLIYENVSRFGFAIVTVESNSALSSTLQIEIQSDIVDSERPSGPLEPGLGIEKTKSSVVSVTQVISETVGQ
jgi:hypothetical protein